MIFARILPQMSLRNLRKLDVKQNRCAVLLNTLRDCLNVMRPRDLRGLRSLIFHSI
jgi:hypothetical protein